MKIEKGEHAIQDTSDYVEWANTLDSAGKDSGPAIERLIDVHVLSYMCYVFNDVIEAGHKMDLLKKWIFYGKEFPWTSWDGVINPYDSIPAWANNLNSHEVIRLFHAISGLVTEPSEMLESFLSSILESNPIDKENMLEELGDTFWYQALGAKFLGLNDFMPVFRGNYGKLVERYGKEWSRNGALYRDKEFEMAEMNKAASFADPSESFDPTAQYNSLEEIVAQLEMVQYADPIGHKLQNNVAFISLKAMVDMQKPVIVKKGGPGEYDRGYEACQTGHDPNDEGEF